MLITAAQVVNSAFSNKSTDLAFVKEQYIRTAQVRFIRPLVGADMYDQLVSEHDAAVYTGSNETLITDYLQPALAFYVKLLVLPDMRVNTTSQGLMINNSEFANAATNQDKAELAASTRDMADTLLREAIIYIEENISAFPLYEARDSSAKNPVGGVILSKRHDNNRKKLWWLP